MLDCICLEMFVLNVKCAKHIVKQFEHLALRKKQSCTGFCIITVLIKIVNHRHYCLFDGGCVMDVSANIGTTLLQALLEHWPKAQMEDVAGQTSTSCISFLHNTVII